jgi:hypothetical protein
MQTRTLLPVAVLLALLAVACGSDGETTTDTTTTSTTTTTTTAADDEDATAAAPDEPVAEAETSTFTAEVWADNWFSLWVNGELVGEDSVPITTERSFNAETFTFEATYPLTIAIEAKDFKETDSGIEYIGLANQQMGDGGLIAQFTDTTTGEIVAVTSGEWTSLAVHRAPLNTDCEKDADPDSTCEFEIIEPPSDWTSASFDDSGWTSATVWSEADVGPKDGYDEISWDPSAALVWGTDLEIDNTVLLRHIIAN